MGKYSQYESRKPRKPTNAVHPIWTGIGFIMIILVPVVTWAGANVLVDLAKAQKWSILNNFPRYMQLPDYLSGIPALYSLTKIDSFPATIVFFFFMLMISTAVFSVLYAAVYRVVGPPRYAPDDIPAPRIKTKPFKR